MNTRKRAFTLFGRGLVLGLATVLICASASVAAMQEFKNLSTGFGSDSREAHPEYSLLLKFAEQSHGMYILPISTWRSIAREKRYLSTWPRGHVLFVDHVVSPIPVVNPVAYDCLGSGTEMDTIAGMNIPQYQHGLLVSDHRIPR